MSCALLMAACAPAPLLFEGTGRAVDLTPKPGQDVRISGSDNVVKLSGPSGVVRVEGKDNSVRLTAPVPSLQVDGEGNSLRCDLPPTRVSLRGRGHRLQVQLPPGNPKPLLDVQGRDQAVQFLSPTP